MVFTMLHAGGKFGDGGYKISGGLHGVGASVVNALSTWLTVTIKQNGKIYQQKYSRGKILTPLEVIGTCRKSETGTKVQFLPDPEIFDKTYFKAAMVRNRLHETAYLNPKLTIHYMNRRKGEETSVDYHEPDGICAYVKKLNEGKKPFTNRFILKVPWMELRQKQPFSIRKISEKISWDSAIIFIR